MLLNEKSVAATAAAPQANTETVLSVFNGAVNFSMHGAAFFLFHTVLSFQSRAAYRRLRELHIMAGFFAGAYSFALCLHLYFFRCLRNPGADALSLMVLLVVLGIMLMLMVLMMHADGDVMGSSSLPAASALSKNFPQFFLNLSSHQIFVLQLLSHLF